MHNKETISKRIIMSILILAMGFISTRSYAVSNAAGSYPINEKIKTLYNENKKNRKNNTNGKFDDIKEFKPIYNIKMPINHQKYLYYLTTNRGLNYKKTLAILKHESQFNANEINGNDYGYMQINKGNHKGLSKTLNTPNTPLNPYVNLFWGTYMLRNLYDTWEKEGISNESIEGSAFTKLDRYVLSSYNKGVAGFKKNGEATNYINNVETELYKINEMLR